MSLKKIISNSFSDMEIHKEQFRGEHFIRVPDVIDIRSEKILWDITFTILNLYMSLVVDYLMNESEIDECVEDWLFLFGELRKKCDDASKIMLISIYLNEQYETLLDWTIKNEYYEGASNLKKIWDLL